MLLLAIDTAGPDCGVAVARLRGGDAEILVSASERIGRGHAERLMPMIEAVLDAAQVTFAELTRIAVTTGPGSFTGVRIGIAAARGLALALDIPAVGVGSLEALAYPAVRAGGDGTVLASIDAKRGEVYLLAQELGSREMIVPASAVRVDQIAARLADAPRPLAFVGSGGPIVMEALGEGFFRMNLPADSPDIADVAALGIRARPVSPLVPLYGRGADAKPQGDKILARA